MKANYIIGIDLGGTTAKLGLFTRDGALCSKWILPTDKRNTGENILRTLANSIQEQLCIRQLSTEDVYGVGLAVPGPVRKEREVAPCANLDGWGGCNVAEGFSRLCGLPVKLANDANAAALGELWQGSAKGVQNMFFVTLGTGVGGSAIINGHIVEGAHGASGEIGHMRLHKNEPRVCGCGKHGCLEQYASATGLVTAANSLLQATDTPSTLRQCKAITAKQIFEHAKQGDPLAGQLTESFASELGHALAIVACVLNPEVIVLGGGVSRAGTFLLHAVEQAFIVNAMPDTESTAFTLASLGNDAGIYGAARLMME